MSRGDGPLVIAAHTVFVDVEDMQVRFLQIWIRLHTRLKLYSIDIRLLELLCTQAREQRANTPLTSRALVLHARGKHCCSTIPYAVCCT
jgi:hypothetical protein